MTPRPLLTHNKRPLSAIFLGNSSSSSFSPNHLPDLPDPPSLGSSPSTTSGLPSPPATNSTGSESTTDGQANSDSLRRPSISSIKSAIMQNGNKSSSRNSMEYRSRTPIEDDDEDFDEDHTAKLSAEDQRLLSKSPREDTSALQRLKSITKRNRMVLEKLAAYKSGSRISTPSPSNALRNSQSPASHPHSAAAASTPNLLETVNNTNSLRRDRSTSVSILSGSETEREHISTSHYSSDDQNSPPSASTSTSNTPFRSLSVRQRRISAPSSPNRARTIHASASKTDQKDLYSSWTSGRRRPSETEEDRPTDVTAAALAAVASMRRSPSSAKRRQPLPREFTDGRSSLDGRRSLDGKRSDGRRSVDGRRSLDGAPLGEPSTPRRSLDRTRSLNQDNGGASPSPRSHAATINDSPQSPRRRTQRYSTIRDVSRRYQTSSQDLTSPREVFDDGGRRQSSRGGSDSYLIESLSGGRSIVTEGLRAAGLSKRKDNEDIFGGETTLQNTRRLRAVANGPPSVTTGHGGYTHTSSSNDSPLREPQTPATTVPQRNIHRNTDLYSSRPISSMAAYNDEPRVAPALSRAPSSAVLLSDRQRMRILAEDERRPLSQSQILTSSTAHDRTHTSFTTDSGRRSLGTPQSDPGLSANPEHTRLMMNALNMFESHLARLPSMGTTTTVTIPDLFRSAQSIVHSSHTLNNMLRKATTRAMEEQIRAEVADNDNVTAEEFSELWRLVGGDHRDSLRVSDELVRTMTDFLLGVGKLLREATTANAAGRHSRGSSLDENLSRRLTPEVASSSGNRSSEDRRSGGGSRLSGDITSRTWESNSGERSDNSRRSSSRADLLTQRLSSSINAARDPDVSRIKDPLERTSRLSIGPSRVFSPRDSRDIPLSASEDSLQIFEPSPTPASRDQIQESRRIFQPVSIPPPLSTLPSESLLARKATKTHRSKASVVSNATVRANSIFPVSSNSTPTTAISNVTTSASGSSSKKPVPRAIQIDTSEPLMSRTLSRSSDLSGSALAELQQHFDRDDRQRTISGGSYTSHERALLSGSETERDTRRLAPSRTRASLDSNGETGVIQHTQLEKKARRMTVTEIFSRN